jgi:hypothetical protein
VNQRHTPIPEIIDGEIRAAINVPGLAHIRTKVELCDGDGMTSGKIDFFAAGHHTEIALIINTDRSVILMRPDAPTTTSWTAHEVDPEVVKAAVLDALRARVRTAA